MRATTRALFGKQLSESKRPDVDLGCLRFLRFPALEVRGKACAHPRSAGKYGRTARTRKNGVELNSEKFFGTFRRAQSFISLEGAIAILGPLPLARWRR
jgi:DNA-directed RNA polymerase specialized sigma24 family protein